MTFSAFLLTLLIALANALSELEHKLDEAERGKQELITALDKLRKDGEADRQSYEQTLKTLEAKWRAEIQQYRALARAELDRSAAAVRELQQKVDLVRCPRLFVVQLAMHLLCSGSLS